MSATLTLTEDEFKAAVAEYVNRKGGWSTNPAAVTWTFTKGYYDQRESTPDQLTVTVKVQPHVDCGSTYARGNDR